MLVEKGAEVDAEDGEGRTALTVALAGGKEAAARALLEAGASVGKAGRGGFCALDLFLSALGAGGAGGLRGGRAGWVQEEEQAVNQCVLDSAGRGRDGEPWCSPFEEAFAELPAGVVPLVLLSDSAQKVELVGSVRATTLQEGEVRTLIEMGADVNAGKGQRALHLAAKNCLHEAVRQLLEATATGDGYCVYGGQRVPA
ncbi:hypothetical protein CYMTET_36302 [Cymbomonas tetramitiformis]|uniref:Uncharacterized protein n=1 Tax=Cymbomonas tetramitiformis TaxID=36881 RepID=A0AAE0F7I5_9CHLO|nr:hypothetical protein CYMTET_36302 [Cymbomonas tetramitiformis]